MTLRHKCTEGNCFKERYLPDWGILKDCFPRGIMPSDVDGIVEVNGYVLMLEWKTPGGALSTGQRIMFESMTRDSKKIRVLVIFGPKGEPQHIQLFQNGKARFKQKVDLEFLRWYCEEWALFAENNKNVAA